jgi:hypothetical protein
MAQDDKLGIQPDEASRWGTPAADETDAEGHGVRRSGTNDDAGVEPDEAFKRGVAEDEDAEHAPGEPDSGRYSDRTLKVAIIPVSW